MGKVTFYEDINDFRNYVESEKRKHIGFGAEAITYLTKDYDVIKDYRDINKVYKPGLYIMDGDIDLNSFIFPKELYVCDGMVCGTRTDYFAGDLFNTFSNIKLIDLDKLVECRDKFIEDIKVITEEGYKLRDLYGNVVFNNKYLKATDTMNYTKEKVDLDTNIEFLDIAIMAAFKFKSYGVVDEYTSFDEGIQLLKKMRG